MSPMSDPSFLSVRGGLFWQQEGVQRTATVLVHKANLPMIEVRYSYYPNLCPACGTEPWTPARLVSRTIKGSREHFENRYIFFYAYTNADRSGCTPSDMGYIPPTDTTPAYFTLQTDSGHVCSQEEAYELIEWDYTRLREFLEEQARCLSTG